MYWISYKANPTTPRVDPKFIQTSILTPESYSPTSKTIPRTYRHKNPDRYCRSYSTGTKNRYFGYKSGSRLPIWLKLFFWARETHTHRFQSKKPGNSNFEKSEFWSYGTGDRSKSSGGVPWVPTKNFSQIGRLEPALRPKNQRKTGLLPIPVPEYRFRTGISKSRVVRSSMPNFSPIGLLGPKWHHFEIS